MLWYFSSQSPVRKYAPEGRTNAHIDVRLFVASFTKSIYLHRGDLAISRHLPCPTPFRVKGTPDSFRPAAQGFEKQPTYVSPLISPGEGALLSSSKQDAASPGMSKVQQSLASSESNFGTVAEVVEPLNRPELGKAWSNVDRPTVSSQDLAVFAGLSFRLAPSTSRSMNTRWTCVSRRFCINLRSGVTTSPVEPQVHHHDALYLHGHHQNKPRRKFFLVTVACRLAGLLSQCSSNDRAPGAVWPVRLIPMKTPLAQNLLDNWNLEKPAANPWTVRALLSAQAQAGRIVGLIIDLSNHEVRGP
jgi:hypothetical protein